MVFSCHVLNNEVQRTMKDRNSLSEFRTACHLHFRNLSEVPHGFWDSGTWTTQPWVRLLKDNLISVKHRKSNNQSAMKRGYGNLYIQLNFPQNPKVILHRNRKAHPKIHMAAQKNWRIKLKFSKKSNPGGTGFKLYSRATVKEPSWNSTKTEMFTNGTEAQT
jgi:hypothetical protein